MIMEKILVTGAAGFIGSHLSELFIQKGYQVIGLDNLSYGSLQNLSSLLPHPKFQFVEGDVRNLNLLVQIGGGIDAIIHLAAYKIPRYGNALETLDVNAKGIENVLKVAQKVGSKVIFASTSDVYGKNPDLPYSERSDFYMGSPTVRRWSYAISKILGEHLCFLYEKEYGVRVVVLRYFGSYGPRQNLTWWGGPQSIFIDSALKNKPMPIHGDGRQTRSFTYVEDTIEGTLRALENQEAVGRVINIGSTSEITILNLGNKIWKLIRGSEPPKYEFVPYRQFSGRYEDVRRRVPDIRLANEILGFHPKFSLEEGLPLTIEWQKGVTTSEGRGA
jgi:UDP-glucose 4-epimerase